MAEAETREAAAAAELCADPNRHAAPAELELRPGLAVFRGYQEFVLTREAMGLGAGEAKARLLAPWVSARFVSGRSVLDLGANSGLYSFRSIQEGARRVTAVDIDEVNLGMLRSAREHFGFQNLEVVRSNVADWSTPADVVIALALVHWVYSCTAVLGSLERVVEHLASLTRKLLLVEWVAPEDPAIDFFHHLDWNPDHIRGPYDQATFENALKACFPRVHTIGEPVPTRRLYVAFRAGHETDLSGPLPLLSGEERLVSSRKLVDFQGVEYWSQVYANPEGTFTKQASLDLASREAALLGRLAGPHFPRALETRSVGGGSVASLERVEGVPLRDAASGIVSDRVVFLRFVDQCLDVLAALQGAGISHRDIRIDNFIVRDGLPVLLDFGWAVCDDLPLSAPPELGDEGRPPDGSFSDVYSMGVVLSRLKGERYPELDPVLSSMADPEAASRLTDLATLRRLFAAAASPAGEPASELQLLASQHRLRRRGELLEAGISRLTRLAGDRQAAIDLMAADLLRQEAEGRELKARVQRLEAQATQAAEANAALGGKLAYLEHELQAKPWRKLVAYLRRRLPFL